MGDTLNNVFTGDEFTISVWTYIEDTFDVVANYYPMILSKWRGTGYADNAFILFVNNFTFGNPIGSNKYYSIKWPMPEVNKWHHYVVVKKSTNTTIYIDGKIVGQASGYTLNNTTYPLTVGAFHNNYYNLKGRIDDIRIYKKALSSEQISYLRELGLIHKLGKIPPIVEVLKYNSITLDAGEGYNSYLWWDGTTTQVHQFINVTENMNNLFVKVKDDYLCYTDTFDIIIKMPESIEQNYSQNTLLYPNPVKDYLNINFKYQMPLEIEITDLKGNSVRKVTPNKGNLISIDLQDLPKTLYLIKIKHLDKTEVFKILTL